MVDRITMIDVIASARVNERAGAAPSGELYAAEKAALQSESDETLRDIFNGIRTVDKSHPATDNDIHWIEPDGTDDSAPFISAPEELHY